MGQVFTDTAIKAKNGKVYAIGQSESGYLIYALCENYSGHVRGGITKSWRYTKDRLTLDEAKAELNRLAGRTVY